jgi:hypothetical protein
VRVLKGVKEFVVNDHYKVSIVDLGVEVVVSADLPPLPWCYEVVDELSIDNVKLIYANVDIPEVGRVEVTGCRVVNDFKVINVKYRVSNVDEAVNIYNKIVKYLTDLCRTSTK